MLNFVGSTLNTQTIRRYVEIFIVGLSQQMLLMQCISCAYKKTIELK